MAFTPRRCACACSSTPALPTYQRYGSYTRACDGKRVPRFRCKQCRRTFSRQTFRLDYRLKRPALTELIFRGFVSKTTQRQLGALLRCDRKTVAHRLELLGEHCRRYHEHRLRRATASAFAGSFQLDELETFETSRRLKPLTVPVLIHRHSHFIVRTEVGTLPPRRPLSPRNQERLDALPPAERVRTSESRICVEKCFVALKSLPCTQQHLWIKTDQKRTYATLLRKHFEGRLVHSRISSKRPKTRGNPLFAVNHTLAMLRDGLSRLVRRNWGNAKKRAMLAWHLWIYTAWRNYVRSITRINLKETPAMAAGLMTSKISLRKLLRWRFLQIAPTAVGASVLGINPTSPAEPA